jgi:hypothetical protein
VTRLLSISTLAALLVVSAALGAGEGNEESAGGAEAGQAAWCTNYSTGSDTHTVCALPGSPPQGPAIVCHNYTIASDTHVECAPGPAPRLGAPRERTVLPVTPPASIPRCYTYHTGSSIYTDCR